MSNEADPQGGLTEERLRRLERRLNVDRQRTKHELDRFQERIVKSKKDKPSFDHLEHTDKSRKHISFVFVYGYIIVIAVIVIGVPLYNRWILNNPEPLELDRLLSQVGALIGSPLGFVVGYYFKEDIRK